MEQKVLFTASTYSHMMNFHLPYLRWFQEQGWQVHVGCGGEKKEIPYADETIDLPLKKSMKSPENWKAAKVLREKVEAEKYDLICTHTALASFFTRHALRGLRERPVVANMVHGYLFDEETPWLKRAALLAAEHWTASVTDIVLTMNRWDYEEARRRKLGRQVVHIPGVGVDFSRLDGQAAGADAAALRAAHGIRREAFVLVYAAEFSKRKSQPVLIRAMTELPEEAVLVLAGAGAEREACRALAKKLGVEQRVIFPGQVSGMGAWYALADGAVTASRSEGLPFNVMEAQHMGLPVVASAVKGHVDLIEDGETGLLYPYGSDGACAAAILRLMEDEPLRHRLGKEARQHVEQFRLESVFPILTNLYAELIPEALPV